MTNIIWLTRSIVATVIYIYYIAHTMTCLRTRLYNHKLTLKPKSKSNTAVSTHVETLTTNFNLKKQNPQFEYTFNKTQVYTNTLYQLK